MKKKVIILIILIIFIFIIIICNLLLVNNSKKISSNDKIPNGYISVFHGGSGEQTYEIYIYKVDNGHDNYRFDYINVTSTTKS